MRDNYRYKLIVGMFAIVLLVFGAYIGFSSVKTKNINETDTNEFDGISNSVMEKSSNENVTTTSTRKYDVEVTYIDYYSLCNEEIIDNKIYYDTTTDDVIKEQSEYQKSNNLEYTLKEDAKDEVVYYAKHSTNCPNHYLVKLEDNSLIVYTRITDEKLEKLKSIDNVVVSMIKESVKEELKKGIRIDGKKELDLVIEDLES